MTSLDTNKKASNEIHRYELVTFELFTKIPPPSEVLFQRVSHEDAVNQLVVVGLINEKDRQLCINALKSSAVKPSPIIVTVKTNFAAPLDVESQSPLFDALINAPTWITDWLNLEENQDKSIAMMSGTFASTPRTAFVVLNGPEPIAAKTVGTELSGEQLYINAYVNLNVLGFPGRLMVDFLRNSLSATGAHSIRPTKESAEFVFSGTRDERDGNYSINLIGGQAIKWKEHMLYSVAQLCKMKVKSEYNTKLGINEFALFRKKTKESTSLYYV